MRDMELPETILCELCGAAARVLANSISDEALAGKMSADDPRCEEGVWVTIDCPNCGWQRQSIFPSP
jgi:hypothetical protein